MRKKRADKRKQQGDPRYNDLVVSKLVNSMMLDGKKHKARKIIYDAFDIMHQKLEEDPLEIFKKSISNIAPVLEIKSRRVGGATYQVPIEVRESRRITLALRWIKNYSKQRREKTMAQKLANELMAAYKGEGASVKKRDDTHRMAEANKAFAHFKW
ncbi:30S ribosomal protein S7 [Candidatus Kapabacteria bacterium]|nr:30S ribosomal protein S7 [Candidatus Kapabacteria bacterium]